MPLNVSLVILQILLPPLKNSSFPRFVYGQVKDFKSTAFGVKLYKFAHEMQIDTLSDELVEFFKLTKSSEIFALFDLHVMSGNKEGLENCKLVRKCSIFPFYEMYYFLIKCNNNTIIINYRSWSWTQKKPLLPRTG